MLNQEIMNLNLKRRSVIDISLSLLFVINSLKLGLNDPNTSDDRKQIVRGSIIKWEWLYLIVRSQLDEFDKAYFEDMNN